MTLAQLEAVVWIVRLGSFRAAASKLNTTQPTISMRIKELELSLGVEIFDRTHRTVQLTPRGRVCVAGAERILEASADLHRTVESKNEISGRVSVGVVEDIALTWLPTLLGLIRDKYPALLVDLQIDLTLPLTRALERGELDVALIGGVVPLTGLQVLSLGFVNYVWMCRPGLVSTKRPLTPKDLQSLPILAWSRQAAAYEFVNHWFVSNGAYPARMNLSNSMTSLASLTMAGLGIGLLPRELYETEVHQGTLSIIHISPPFEPSPYSAIYKPVHWSPVGQVVAKLAAEVSTFHSKNDARRSAMPQRRR
jgi:DNA-binding transcriptional LysR family regulator